MVALKSYFEMATGELLEEKAKLEEEYSNLKKLNLELDMSRGKPCPEQLALSHGLLDSVTSQFDFSEQSSDVRNYGMPKGLPELRELFAKIMDLPSENVFIGGNSSLNLMFDAVGCFFGEKNGEKIKFLCPVPGYDRHFAICEYFGIEMIPIKMNADGPDMDTIEKIVAQDSSVCGIWCVPKYSNPTGATYSDEIVERFASLNPKSKRFKIFWDLAYAVHNIAEKDDKLKSIYAESRKRGTLERVICFSSTSKITFAGGGVSAFAAFDSTMAKLERMYSVKIISHDKINQLRHIKFLKTFENLKEHMKKHRKILEPKFKIVLESLEKNFNKNPIITWTRPNGGYFISVDTFGSASRVHELCKKIGLTTTPARATFPYHNDPNDSNLRIAPSYPDTSELETAMEVFCVCTKIAALEKLLKNTL